MYMNELLTFVDQVHQFFLKRDQLDPEREMLYRHLKLTEEVGELSNDVMTYLGHQRQDKQQWFDKQALGHETVDVVITALLIAKMADVDLQEAFAYKIDKIQSRLGLGG